MGLLNAPDPVLLATLTMFTGVAALLRCWIRHRTVVRIEEEHTRRVQLAVQGSITGHRADVVSACAELEAASRARVPKTGHQANIRAVRSP
jgi:hypothetical protein